MLLQILQVALLPNDGRSDKSLGPYEKHQVSMGLSVSHVARVAQPPRPGCDRQWLSSYASQ